MAPKFTSPAEPMIFNARVWEIVRRVPSGRVTTYGRIAALLEPPQNADPARYRAFGARWVGSAMSACPDQVPWWRVINARGEISPRPGADAQRELLEAEGIIFDERGRVDLRSFGWPD